MELGWGLLVGDRILTNIRNRGPETGMGERTETVAFRVENVKTIRWLKQVKSNLP